MPSIALILVVIVRNIGVLYIHILKNLTTVVLVRLYESNYFTIPAAHALCLTSKW